MDVRLRAELLDPFLLKFGAFLLKEDVLNLVTHFGQRFFVCSLHIIDLQDVIAVRSQRSCYAGLV